jgi:hypothetical protein
MYAQETLTFERSTSEELQTLGYPIVSLEAFFKTSHYDSIGGNIYERPDLSFYIELLQKIRSRPDVEDVLVEITSIEIQELGSEYVWPHSERLYIITRLSREALLTQVEPLKHDENNNELNLGPHLSMPKTVKGYNVFAFRWW